MDRRDFLSTGAGVAAALAVTAGAAAVQPAAWLAAAVPAEGLSRARFEAWLNSSFRVRALGALRSSRATLIAIENGPRAPGLEQFHLLFRCDGPAMTGLYELRHESGAMLQLRLDEGGREGAAALSRATFNLIAKG